METSKLSQNHNRHGWQEAVRAPKRPSSRAPECRFDRTAWDLTVYWQYASGTNQLLPTGRRSEHPATGRVEKILSSLPPTPHRRREFGSATELNYDPGAARFGSVGIAKWTGIYKGQLTLRTCPHQPCSEEERYQQSHLGPHLSCFHCAPCVPFSSDAREGILASMEPVVHGRNRGEGVCGEGIGLKERGGRRERWG